jgi:hypothetical protein
MRPKRKKAQGTRFLALCSLVLITFQVLASSCAGYRKPAAKSGSDAILFPGGLTQIEVTTPLVSARLEGIVTFPPGGGAAGVRIELFAADRSAAIETTSTNAGGEFRFSLHPDGNYAIRISKEGFNTVIYKILKNSKARNSTLKLQIQVSG